VVLNAIVYAFQSALWIWSGVEQGERATLKKAGVG
jgi:hypothetical protein